MTRIWSSSPLLFSAKLLLACLFLSSLSASQTSASRGGVEDPGNKFTVGFTYNDGTIPSVCSGILIAPKIIVTARHCVRNDNGVDGSGYNFTNPGARIDGPATAAKVSRIIISDEDLAFIILDISLSGGSYLKVADEATIATLADLSPVVGYGYGAVFEPAAPFSPLVRSYGLDWRSQGRDSKMVNTFELTSNKASACRGDSGGPITAKLANGEIALLAVMSGAANVQGTCGSLGSDGLYRMRVTLVSPYLKLIPEYTGVPIAEPTPTPVKKIIKITCLKGKVKKVVSGTKPKCPKGYTLKK
jgi:hypothetical protein